MCSMYYISIISVFLIIISAVYGASPTVWGKYPGVVSVTSSSQNSACVGHLVDKQHVVTPAQCLLAKGTFEILDVFWLKVTAGDINLLEPTQYRAERNVTNIFSHQLFNPDTNENDIALLRLDAPLPLPHNTIEPVMLNSRIVATSTQCDFVGWNLDKQEPSEQQATTMLVYDRDFCNSQQYPGRIFESVMCGQLQVADELPKDNIGGGLYCRGELTGLLTMSQTGTAIPSVFTQIRFFNNWIKVQLAHTIYPEKRKSPIKSTEN